MPGYPSFFNPEYEALLLQVSQKMIEQKSPFEIKTELDINETTFRNAMAEVRRRWQERQLSNMEDWIDQELARLAELEKELWPLVRSGALRAFDSMVLIIRERAKLLGLNAPKKVDITVRIRQMAIENGMDPDEAVREADRLLKSGQLE